MMHCCDSVRRRAGGEHLPSFLPPKGNYAFHRRISQERLTRREGNQPLLLWQRGRFVFPQTVLTLFYISTRKPFTKCTKYIYIPPSRVARTHAATISFAHSDSRGLAVCLLPFKLNSSLPHKKQRNKEHKNQFPSSIARLTFFSCCTGTTALVSCTFVCTHILLAYVCV